MSKHRPGTKGTLNSYEPKKGEKRWLVSAIDTLDTRHPKYQGPTAEVWNDDAWLYIQTDKYEGHVMLNIEALPHLRQALGKVARALAAAQTKQSNT